jgi:hypothetical protein
MVLLGGRQPRSVHIEPHRSSVVATGTLDRPAPRARCLPTSVAIFRLEDLEDLAGTRAQPASPRGNTTSTLVPSSFVDRTRISPRCAITICCEM